MQLARFISNKVIYFIKCKKLFFKALFFIKTIPTSFNLCINKSGFTMYDPNSVIAV